MSPVMSDQPGQMVITICSQDSVSTDGSQQVKHAGTKATSTKTLYFNMEAAMELQGHRCTRQWELFPQHPPRTTAGAGGSDQFRYSYATKKAAQDLKE